MHKLKMRRVVIICILVLSFAIAYNLNSVFARTRPRAKGDKGLDQQPAQVQPPAAAAEDKDEEQPDEKQDEKQAGQQETSQAEKPGAAKEDKDKKAGKEETKEEIKKDLTPPAPAIEIKRLESEKPLYSIELRNVELADLFRVIAHDYNLNILVDKDVQGKITASFTNISLEEALEGIADMTNLVIEKKGNILKISPNLITKTFILKYIEAKNLIEAPQASAQGGGAAPVAKGAAGTAGGQQGAGKQSQTGSIYDLLSDKGKLLLGKQPNSITVIDYPPNVAKIEEYLNATDKNMTIKIFKLKYLKAGELVGSEISPAQPGTTAASSYSTSGSTSKAGSSK